MKRIHSPHDSIHFGSLDSKTELSTPKSGSLGSPLRLLTTRASLAARVARKDTLLLPSVKNAEQ